MPTLRAMKPARLALVAPLSLVALAAGVSACHKEPDLAAVRDGLAKNAAVVCAPAPTRPPHGTPTREVPESEAQAALVKLCDNPTDATAPLVVHDALLGQRAVIGQLRRNVLEESVTSVATVKCTAASPGLDAHLLDAAIRARSAGDLAQAFDRCADVVALARDEDLTGNLTALFLANGHLQHAVRTCLPFVDDAKPAEAAAFAKALGILRASFPKNLDEVYRRDRAETSLATFGRARAAGRSLGCGHADALAASFEQKAPPPGELVARWHAAEGAAPEPPNAKYVEAYTLTLGALDRLVSLAELKGR